MSQAQQKSSLKPAHEIYARLIWDETVAPDGVFTIGYEDRFLGVMEATRADFEEAEIPYHRIRYFKNGAGDIIWHRERRQDLITTTTTTAITDSDSENTNAGVETTEAREAEAALPAHRSKKAIIKEKRARSLQQQRESARGEKEEEERIEREHAEELGSRMEEVEERIRRFQTTLKKSGERTVEGEGAPAEEEGAPAEES